VDVIRCSIPLPCCKWTGLKYCIEIGINLKHSVTQNILVP
jgi:hypothetical protein